MSHQCTHSVTVVKIFVFFFKIVSRSSWITLKTVIKFVQALAGYHQAEYLINCNLSTCSVSRCLDCDRLQANRASILSISYTDDIPIKKKTKPNKIGDVFAVINVSGIVIIIMLVVAVTIFCSTE